MKKRSILEPSPLRNECHRVIIANPGITMMGVARILGETSARIDHLIRRLVTRGDVLLFQPHGQGKPRSYYDKRHADQIPEVCFFDQCRADWLGYDVHKVFGAGGLFKLHGDKLAERFARTQRGVITPVNRVGRTL